MLQKREPRRIHRGVTRKQVAEAAGVSVTTVTHALNPPPGTSMAEATRQRVVEAARMLGYKPSFAGKALVSGKTYTVGLLQPQHRMFAYPIYNRIVQSLSYAAEAAEYHILLLPLTETDRWLKPIRQRRMDGVFVLQSDIALTPIQAIEAEEMPIVILNTRRPRECGRRVSAVTCDNAGVVRQTLARFTAEGARSFCALHSPSWSDSNAVLQETFSKLTLEGASEGIIGSTVEPSLSPQQGREQIRALLQAGQRFDAYLVDGSQHADILLEELQAAGITPGEDCRVAVIRDQGENTPGDEQLTFTPDFISVGEQGWEAMKSLMSKEGEGRDYAVEYRRVGGE
ncbi:MAG: LacI family DNA-binding transcriptional regulator [Planctomycetota bacterium]|jgi:LacI family transcriptional regulator